MNSLQNQDRKKPSGPADDEVGKPLWKIPTTDEIDVDEDEDVEVDDSDEIRPVPRSEGEMGIHAPEFDPLQQQEWEERERLRRQKEEEDQRRENPRGVWKM